MPAPEEILSGLHQIANDLFVLAVVWHAAIFVALAALLAGWRPSQRHAAMLLTLPLASVGIVAFAYRNPFNGAVFASLAVTLAIRARRMRSDRVAIGTRWSAAIGVAMIAFGSVYPHFLDTQSAWPYVFGAPVGLIPCPSLAVVVGFMLLGGGFADRSGSLILSIAGLFYGVFGAARLGVRLDFALLAGGLALAWVALHPNPRSRRSAARGWRRTLKRATAR